MYVSPNGADSMEYSATLSAARPPNGDGITVTASGSCEYVLVEVHPPFSDSGSTGDMTLTCGSGMPVSITGVDPVMEMGTFTTYFQQPLWTPGETITLAGKGWQSSTTTDHVGAFTVNVTAPMTQLNAAPVTGTDGGTSIPKSSDLHVSWDFGDAGAPVGYVKVSVSQNDANYIYFTECAFKADALSGVVPGSLLSKLNTGFALVSVFPGNCTGVALGRYSVEAQAYGVLSTQNITLE